MAFYCKTLCSRILNKSCFNNNYFLMNNNKLCRLQYFSSVHKNYLFDHSCKPLKLSNKNQINSPSNYRNFILNLTFDFTRKIKKLRNKLFLIERKKHVELAAKLYTTLRNVNHQEFFTLLEIPDTLNSWFQVIELHIWMLLVRLQQEQGTQEELVYISKVKTILIDLMWEDLQMKARTLAPMNTNLKKNMTQFYHEFRMGLFSYDEALLKDDKALASSLWCHFFNKNCDDPRKLEILVSYVRYQMDQLQLLTVENLNNENTPKTIWKPLNDHLKNKLI